MKAIKRLLFLLSAIAVAAAVLKELRLPPPERQWHGYVFGCVPYDFRPPSFDRFKEAWWDPDDERLFTPRDFGIGWAVNLARAIELVQGRQTERRSGDETV